MNKNTGFSLSALDHLKQSIQDILTTPMGSRVMRREYGSRLFDLLDQPSNEGLMIEIYAATAEALYRWEPRIQVKTVVVEKINAGSLILSLTGRYQNKPIQINQLTIQP